MSQTPTNDLSALVHQHLPVVVNNRDLMVSCLLYDLCRLGATEIHLIDNASTYPPLVSWLDSSPPALCRPQPQPDGNQKQIPLYVYRWDNCGPRAACRVVQRWALIWRDLGATHYVTTDSDLDLSGIVDDGLHLLVEAQQFFAKRHPGQCVRVGSALEIPLADTPAAAVARAAETRYWHSSERIDWHSKFFVPSQPWIPVYRAPLDTTLAVYPFDTPWDGSYEPAYRMAGPCLARHRPWYHDDANRPDDFRHYLRHADPHGTVYTAHELSRTR